MNDRRIRQADFVNIAKEKGVKLGKSNMSQYVSGKTVPRREILNFIADYLNVSPEWLSGETDADMKTGIKSDKKTEKTESASAAKSRKRTFDKSEKLNNVLYDVRGPVVDEANRMERTGTGILKLNIGNPATYGFRAIKQIPNVGIDDIYTGNGVSELINMSMSALLNNGDEVLIPSPDYPLWTACVNLSGGKPVHYICDERSDWYPDISDIRSKITSRTKAIVIINPNNPTGALYERELLEQITEIAREYGLIIFSDEIYDRLVMDDLKHISIASLAPDLFCVTYSGLSKSHMIAGYRVGWMILSGNKSTAKGYIEGLNMLSNMRLCSNVPAQSIVQTALGGYQSVNDYIVPGGRIYEQRNYIWEALNSIDGISAVKPKAAFYIFPKIDTKKYNIFDDEQFALDLLKEKKILIVHGGGFNWHAPDHFRIVYLPQIEVLKKATANLKNFLQTYRQ